MNRFFIIGSPRSGTTLLRLMLNRHESITVPPEAGFMTWLYQKYFSYEYCEVILNKFVNDLLSTKKIDSWNMVKEELICFLIKSRPNTYSDLIDAVYLFFSQSVCNKNVIYLGDKNNFFINEIELINKLYPKSKFIHIVRDGRSVAVSYMGLNKKKLKSKNAPKLPSDISEIATVWKNDIDKTTSSLNSLNQDRVYTILFENLINEPKNTILEICHFLGLEFDSKMLTYYDTKESEGLEPPEFLDWKEKNSKPILLEEAYKYKLLTKCDFDKFTDVAMNELNLFGYLSNEH